MPTTEPILLDTHVLLWWQAESERLPPAAREHIDAAGRRLVSPISCWEIAMLVEKKRIVLDRPTMAWVRDLLAGDDVGLAELTPEIAVLAGELADFHGDPADRLLYATARVLDVALLTKDRLLHNYAASRPAVTVVW